ncbi:uncharacterized protein PHACADRAFT_211473 [Phanerochaete carnosa HHB-10118-sp]|uniref:F-box domain-containing protein n=1 Tax=Phanerochaete carnosa (strain HHB-10118-sp) TaxID=650164 RepID=K5W4H8_PHACS|nr:uncharacterized protein PHACADRAFT_211473 [Phanerochaete carnosa HHB-10118-sp]EKM53834.1 hypothetical protein PHACADRAFT_211473 [Phanerochaete carnosa HHB-10118-sp]
MERLSLATIASGAQYEYAEPGASAGSENSIAYDVEDSNGKNHQGADVGEIKIAVTDNPPEVTSPGDKDCVFPCEVTELIIDHVDQLQSRGVLPKHITVQIQPPQKTGYCGSDSPEDPDATLYKFYTFISQSSPSITHSIRLLRIYSGSSRYGPVSLASVWDVVIKLPSLRTLDIASTTIVGRIQNRDAVHSFASLQLSQFTKVDIYTLLDLLLLSRNLTSLSLRSTSRVYKYSTDGINAYTNQVPPACVALRSLELAEKGTIPLFAGPLLPMLSASTLTRLSLRCFVTSGDVATGDTGKLIHHAHRTLEHVGLNLTSSTVDKGTQETASTGLNLGLCTSLVSFDLALSCTCIFLQLFVRTLFNELFSRRTEYDSIKLYTQACHFTRIPEFVWPGVVMDAQEL